MAKTVKLEVITPSKMFYRGEVELVVVTTPQGEEGFMANHSWAVKLVDIGAIRIREPGASVMKEAFVSGGYIDVKESILVYVDAAEWVDDIDFAKAEKQKADSEAFLKSVKRGAYDRKEWLESGLDVVLGRTADDEASSGAVSGTGSAGKTASVADEARAGWAQSVCLPDYGDDLPPALALEVQRVERKLRRAQARIRLVKKHQRRKT